MREDVLLDVDADPAQRDSLGLADGHREGDADRELPALELKGAHVVRREHRGDGDFPALLGPPFSGRPSRAEEHPGEHGRVPAQPGDDHPSPVADALGDVPEGDDGGADLAPENVRRQASVLDARQVLLGVLVALWAFYSVVLLSDLCAVPTISPQSRIG